MPQVVAPVGQVVPPVGQVVAGLRQQGLSDLPLYGMVFPQDLWSHLVPEWSSLVAGCSSLVADCSSAGPLCPLLLLCP